MKRVKKNIITGIALMLLTGTVSAASPQFSMKMNGGMGAYNLNQNPIVKEIPGFSDKADFDFSFDLKGNFGKEAGYQSVGYAAGAKINLAEFLTQPKSSVNGARSDANKNSNYSKIQKMIDWYEANKHYYGLPDNPFETGEWPTTSYSEGNHHIKFIDKTTVENAYDVDWNRKDESAWDAANALYRDIKFKIDKAIEGLYSNIINLSTSRDITQDDFAKMTDKQRFYAQKKIEAMNSFAALASDSVAYPYASGYVEFTNVANAIDIKANIGGDRLRAGKLISSERAGQKAFGSSVSLGLTRGLVDGLNADITVGISGGVAQQPENWDTQHLEYNYGKYGELAAKVNADYTYELTDLKLALIAGVDFIMPDILVTPTNNSGAVRLGVHWNDHREFINEYGFYLVEPQSLRNLIEIENNTEFTYVLSKDRYDMYDKLSFSYGLRNDLYVSAYGAELELDVAHKAPKFENKYKNQVEDRFSAKSAYSDFRAANLKSATFIDLDLSFNTFRLFNTELFTMNAGFETFLYGSKMYGVGFNVGMAFNLVDYVKKDLIIKADLNWYKNDNVKVFDDMAKLKKPGFMDYAVISVGIEYIPYKNFKVGLDFVTAPSPSRRYIERLTSVKATASVAF